MLALKEFITFITHHKATLAQTYAQLLAERGVGYEVFPPESSLASARRVLNAVIAAYEAEQATPLCNLFDPQTEASRHRWHERLTPPQPMLEVECLGQTLTAVVTNLEAGKFLWQILAAARATMMVVQPTSSPSAPDKVESVKEILSPNQALPVTYTTLEFTFDNMPIVYLEWDLEGKITRWNKKATEIFGWTFTEALRSNIFELIVPGEYHDNVTDVVETIKGGVSHQNVNENVTKDGQRLLMEWYNELVRTRDEEIVGVASVGFDITERIAQEQQTQESLERRTRQVQTSTEVAQEIAAAPALARTAGPRLSRR
jgi:PAS domain S-box-containing protein